MFNELWRQLGNARVVATALLALFLTPGVVAAQTQTVVEYYYAAWGYYFVTSDPAEIAYLDGGAFGGVWQRTGQTFNVFAQGSATAQPACRFFSLGFAPKSSHFYTPFASECALVKTKPEWQYEGIAFYLELANASGNCAPGRIPLYRAYNEGMGGAPNHRYTTSAVTLNQMVAAGWTFEGHSITRTFACVPQSATTGTAEGFWAGYTNTNVQLFGVVLDNGTFYVLYTTPGGNNIAGVVQGASTSNSGQFTSANAKDFNITGLAVTNAAVAGSYVAGVSLSGVIVSAYGSASYSATYQQEYNQPASLVATAGSYAGSAASSVGVQSTAVNVSSSGVISGAAPGCSFNGTASPRGSVNVFNVSIKFNGGFCVFGTSTLVGIAYYDASTRTLYASAPNASRTDGFLFVGSKP